MIITDGTGSGGYSARVDSKNRLYTNTASTSVQSESSLHGGKAFQVVSGPVDVTAANQEILLIKNASTNLNLVVTYIRVQTANVAVAGEVAFSSVNLGGIYTSGGTAVTPTNMNTSSGVTTGAALFYSGATAIVASGYAEIDRNYSANTEVIYNKEGSIVIAPGGILSVNFIGSSTDGVVYARASFYLHDVE